jgi:hypothetical protein
MASSDCTGIDIKQKRSDNDDSVTVDQVQVADDIDAIQESHGDHRQNSTQSNPLENVENEASRKDKKMENLEIDSGGDEEQPIENNVADESFESGDGDLQSLLGPGDGSSQKSSKPQRHICSKAEKVGNMRIFLPAVFFKTGWGIAGPHWFGPFCVLFLVGLASHYFVGISLRRIGPITAAICIIFAAASAYNLANVAFRDPGVVKLQPSQPAPHETEGDQRLQYRWCDRCQVGIVRTGEKTLARGDNLSHPNPS